MNYRLLFIINAVALALFGALLLIMPEFGLNLFNTETYDATLFVARFLGGGLLLAGLFVWFAKEFLTDPRMERNMVIVLLSSSVIGFLLSLLGIVSFHVIRENGWVLLVIHILFAAAYGFLLSGVSIVPKGQQQYRKEV